MTNVLIIDTSTDAVAIACGTTSAQATQSIVAQQAFHSENILVAINECVAGQGLVPRDIDVIGVGLGPGLFTGLRVGVSAAHSIAHALGAPLVGFSSLELAAGRPDLEGHCERNEGPHFIVAKDARRHELYYSHLRRRDDVGICEVDGVSFVSSMERLRDESLISPEKYVEYINRAESNVTILLDDVERYEEFMNIDVDVRSRIIPLSLNPSNVIDLVVSGAEKSFVLDPLKPKVLYLRKSDAELSWGKL